MLPCCLERLTNHHSPLYPQISKKEQSYKGRYDLDVITVKQWERCFLAGVRECRKEQRNAINNGYHAGFHPHWSRYCCICAFLCIFHWKLCLCMHRMCKCSCCSKRCKHQAYRNRRSSGGFFLCNVAFRLSPYLPHPYRPCQTQRATESGRA